MSKINIGKFGRYTEFQTRRNGYGVDVMIMIVISAILGVLCAIAFDLYIPAAMSTYAAVLIIAAFDSVMGAYKSLLCGQV